jgi:hypothetical protein
LPIFDPQGLHFCGEGVFGRHVISGTVLRGKIVAVIGERPFPGLFLLM